MREHLVACHRKLKVQEIDLNHGVKSVMGNRDNMAENVKVCVRTESQKSLEGMFL